MAVQIPLSWQLTDFLSAMGIGFLCAAVYTLFETKTARGLRLAVKDAVWSLATLILIQSWVISQSHAAQFRWSILLAVALGCMVFWRWVAQKMKRCMAPLSFVGRAFAKYGHCVMSKITEKGKSVIHNYQKHHPQKQKSASQPAKMQYNRKKNEKMQQKELQNKREIYYNSIH